MGNTNINQRGFSPNRYFGFLNLTRQYFKFLATQAVTLPAYGVRLQWDNFFRSLSPVGNLYPRNLAAYYPNDSTAIYLDGSNNVTLWEDRSGNSATNTLCLNGIAGNDASMVALTAFGTSDFTVSIAIRQTNFTNTQFLVGGATNSFGIKTNAGAGNLVATLVGTSDRTTSTGTLIALTRSVVTYVRTSGTGTYYIDGVIAGTTPDTINYSVGMTRVGSREVGNQIVGNIGWIHVYSVALDANGVAADVSGVAQSNCIFNADFSKVPKLATSFTESSSNAATVTINSTGDTGARVAGERDLYQGTAAMRPAYTAPVGRQRLVITFDGAGDYLKTPSFSLSQPETIYFVGSQVTWTAVRKFYDGNSATERMAMGQLTSTPGFDIFAGTDTTLNSNLPLNTRGIIVSQFNGANSYTLVNRTGQVTGNCGTQNGNGFTLGANIAGATTCNMTVSEIAIYAEAQSNQTVAAIQNYFANKYQIGL